MAKAGYKHQRSRGPKHGAVEIEPSDLVGVDFDWVEVEPLEDGHKGGQCNAPSEAVPKGSEGGLGGA